MEQFAEESEKIYSHSKAFLKLIGSRESIEGMLILLIGFSLYANTVSSQLIFGVLILLSSLFYTHTLNDIYDFNIDLLNKRNKPLVQGYFSIRFAKHIAGYFFVSTIFFGLIANYGFYLFFALTLLVLGFLYSYPATSFSKNPVLAMPTILLGYVVVPFYMGIYSAATSFPTLSDHGLVLGLILMVAGRIFLKDVRDRKGDKAHGRNTLALLLRTKYLFLLSSGLFIFGIAFIYLAIIEVIQKDYTFLLLSVAYFLFVSWTLFQQCRIPENKQGNSIRPSLIKIYLASRLYLIVILGFLLMNKI
jgi:geranylgeranylglycerol-phosphate geranylgeranyltransferase